MYLKNELNTSRKTYKSILWSTLCKIASLYPGFNFEKGSCNPKAYLCPIEGGTGLSVSTKILEVYFEGRGPVPNCWKLGLLKKPEKLLMQRSCP